MSKVWKFFLITFGAPFLLAYALVKAADKADLKQYKDLNDVWPVDEYDRYIDDQGTTDHS